MSPQQSGRLGIGIVGAGHVGPVLGAALAAAGHAVVGISAVSERSRDRAEAILPGAPVLPVQEVVERSELVLLAVPDDQLEGLVQGLATTGAWQAGQLVVHTSPVHGLEALRPGARGGGDPAGDPPGAHVHRDDDRPRPAPRGVVRGHRARAGAADRAGAGRRDGGRAGARRRGRPAPVRRGGRDGDRVLGGDRLAVGRDPAPNWACPSRAGSSRRSSGRPWTAPSVSPRRLWAPVPSRWPGPSTRRPRSAAPAPDGTAPPRLHQPPFVATSQEHLTAMTDAPEN